MGQPGLQQFSSDVLGAGFVDFAPNLTNKLWRVYQLTVTSIPAAVFGVQLLLNGIPITSYRVGLSPQCASGDPYIEISPSTTMRVSVTNGPLAVTQYEVAYQFDELDVT